MKQHNIIMIACCVIPIVAIGAVFLLGVSWRYAALALVMLCPLMHLLAMRDSGNCSHGVQGKK